jgi:hypothetical protein
VPLLVPVQAMTKVHNHSEQFDGAMHPWCGRGKTAVLEHVFEATPAAERCSFCSRDWFPGGQPDWHYRAAVDRLKTITQPKT